MKATIAKKLINGREVLKMKRKGVVCAVVVLVLLWVSVPAASACDLSSSVGQASSSVDLAGGALSSASAASSAFSGEEMGAVLIEGTIAGNSEQKKAQGQNEQVRLDNDAKIEVGSYETTAEIDRTADTDTKGETKLSNLKVVATSKDSFVNFLAANKITSQSRVVLPESETASFSAVAHQELGVEDEEASVVLFDGLITFSYAEAEASNGTDSEQDYAYAFVKDLTVRNSSGDELTYDYVHSGMWQSSPDIMNSIMEEMNEALAQHKVKVENLLWVAVYEDCTWMDVLEVYCNRGNDLGDLWVTVGSLYVGAYEGWDAYNRWASAYSYPVSLFTYYEPLSDEASVRTDSTSETSSPNKEDAPLPVTGFNFAGWLAVSLSLALGGCFLRKWSIVYG